MTVLRTVTGLIQLLLALLLIAAAPTVACASSDGIPGLEAGRSLQYLLVVEPDGDRHDLGLGPLAAGPGDDDGPGSALIDRADQPAIAPLPTGGATRLAPAPRPALHDPCAAPPTGPPSA